MRRSGSATSVELAPAHVREREELPAGRCAPARGQRAAVLVQRACERIAFASAPRRRGQTGGASGARG